MSVGLARLDKMFLIGIWVETLLYGVNCGLFGTALYALIVKRSTNPSSPWLIAMSTFLFCISTAYVALTVRQLLDAFIYGPDGGAAQYFTRVTPLYLAKLVLFSVNVISQNLILIWRLWAVFGHSWKIAIFPLFVELMQMVATSIALGEIASGRSLVLARDMVIVCWATDLGINIGVTTVIAYRLWSMGRAVSLAFPSTGKQRNMYHGIMMTMIESGLLFSTALLGVAPTIYLIGLPASLTAIDSIVQLATITPVLIIVRVGLGLTQHQCETTTGGSTIPMWHPNAQVSIQRAGHIKANIVSGLPELAQLHTSTAVLYPELHEHHEHCDTPSDADSMVQAY